MTHLKADADAIENCVCDGRHQHPPDVQIPEGDVAHPNENMDGGMISNNDVEEIPVEPDVEVEEMLVQPDVEVEEIPVPVEPSISNNEERLRIRHLKSKILNKLSLYNHLTFDLKKLDTTSRQSLEALRGALDLFNLPPSFTKQDVITAHRNLAREYHPDKVAIPDFAESTNGLKYGLLPPGQ